MTELRRSRVVITPWEDYPYKVVLEHEDGSSSEHPVATIREGEALIRTNSPAPPPERMENLRESPNR